MYKSLFPAQVEYIAKILEGRGYSRGLINDLLVPKNPDLEFTCCTSRDVDRLIRAIINNERIAILYDVDTDGIAGGTLTSLYIESHGIRPIKLINSNRRHGITEDTIEECIRNKVRLLICVDSATNDTEQMKRLTEIGTSVLVLDHHELEVTEGKPKVEEMKDVYLVNCTLGGYGNRYLSGAGTAFRYIQEVEKRIHGRIKDKTLFDKMEMLVGLTIYSDYCSMLSLENRYFANNLLSRLQQETAVFPFIHCFSEYGISANTLSFSIIPAINALIRTGREVSALEFVYSKDDGYTQMLKGESREAIDIQRKAINNILSQRSIKTIGNKLSFFDLTELDPNPMPKEIIHNITGLLANEIKEATELPTVVINREKGGGNQRIRGSFRGTTGAAYKDIFNEAGITALGHQAAFGLATNTEEFSAGLSKVIELLPEENREKAKVDIEFTPSRLEIMPREMEAIAVFNELTGNNLGKILIGVPLDKKVSAVYEEQKYCTINSEGVEIVAFNSEKAKKCVSEGYAIVSPSLNNNKVSYYLN